MTNSCITMTNSHKKIHLDVSEWKANKPPV